MLTTIVGQPAFTDLHALVANAPVHDCLPPQGMAEHVAGNLEHYRIMFDSNEAHEMPLAEPLHSRLTSFQRMCFLR